MKKRIICGLLMLTLLGTTACAVEMPAALPAEAPAEPVETPAESAGGQCIDHSLFIHQKVPGKIQQHGITLHHGEFLLGDHMLRRI